VVEEFLNSGELIERALVIVALGDVSLLTGSRRFMFSYEGDTVAQRPNGYAVTVYFPDHAITATVSDPVLTRAVQTRLAADPPIQAGELYWVIERDDPRTIKEFLRIGDEAAERLIQMKTEYPERED